MQAAFILLAAGRGRRLGKTKPKALLKIGGVPVFIYSLLQCRKVKLFNQIVIAVPRGYKEEFREALVRYSIKNAAEIVTGGYRRVDSVYNAVCAVGKSDFIFIHDAARPFISKKLLEDVFRMVRKHPAVVPAVPVRSTLKYCRGGFAVDTLERAGIYEVQTPQAFRFELIKAALVNFKNKKLKGDILDDAYLVELMGKKVKISRGDISNFKITYPDDLKLARLIVKSWK